MCLAPASDLQRTHHEDSSNTGCVIEHPVQTDARGIASSTNVPDRERKRQYLLTVFVGDMVSLFAGHRPQEHGRSSPQEKRVILTACAQLFWPRALRSDSPHSGWNVPAGRMRVDQGPGCSSPGAQDG
jgi:hypothetical protein